MHRSIPQTSKNVAALLREAGGSGRRVWREDELIRKERSNISGEVKSMRQVCRKVGGASDSIGRPTSSITKQKLTKAYILLSNRRSCHDRFH